MRIDYEARRACMAVGEFARFLLPRAEIDGEGGLWRARVGTRWHSELAAQEAERSPDCRFEVAVTGTIEAGGWSIELDGRADQLDRSGSRPVLREVKTVPGRMPTRDEAEGPDWLAARLQIACYAHLLDLPQDALLELVFIEIASGIVGVHQPAQLDRRTVLAHAAEVANLLEAHRSARAELRGEIPPDPFDVPREGQAAGIAALHEAVARERIVCFEAPTGFGKTAAVVHAALSALRAGTVDRILYLTAKNSTQAAIAAEFSRQLGRCGAPADLLFLRSRAEHCINDTFHCHPALCGHLKDATLRWPHALGGPASQSAHPSWTLDSAREEGGRHSVCPYELSRSLLAWRHIWIADCNYVLSPAHASVFLDCPDFSPARTFLILDEAHNLPARTADAHSFEAVARDAAMILGILDFRNVPAALRAVWEEWCDWLAGLRACEVLEPPEEDALRALTRRAADHLEKRPPDSLEIGLQATQALWSLAHLRNLLDDTLAPRLAWAPADGTFRLSVLDPAALVRRALHGFHRVVLQSATLSPIDTLLELCGCADAGAATVRAPAPWRDRAYRVAVDTRVDTRLSHRYHHLPTTADTLRHLHEAARGPVAAFFPSFEYASRCLAQLEQSTALRATLQPRGVSPADLQHFVEEAVVTHDVLLLVLGGTLSEGIDALGGRITHALVAGPALPEVNPLQKARVSALRGLTREQAFRRVYQIPAMHRVNQALGRLVRAPGHTATVVLHCRRFAEPDYASLLDPACQFFDTVSSTAELDTWLG